MSRTSSSARRAIACLVWITASTLSACGGGGGGGGSTAAPPGPQSPVTPSLNPAPNPSPTGDAPLGELFGITSSGRLISFNRTGATLQSAVTITGLPPGESIVGFDVRPTGEVFAFTRSGNAYTIEPRSGVATDERLVEPLALDGNNFGVEFNAREAAFNLVSDTGATVNLATPNGNGFILRRPSRVQLAAAPETLLTGVTEVAGTNNLVPCASQTTLYYLDTVQDRLLVAADATQPTLLTVVGSLGVDARASSGFEIVQERDGSNTALAVIDVNGAQVLHTIDLESGAARPSVTITGLGAGETVVGLAAGVPAVPAAFQLGTLLAVSETNRLLSFNDPAPLTLCFPSVAIRGLQAGENVLGIDVRPTDGQVYALTSSRSVYTLNVTRDGFAMATLRVAGQGVLTGASFGVSFDPVTDRLRVIGDAGLDLTIDVDSGQVTSGIALRVRAMSFTNSLPGVSLARLYSFDEQNRLFFAADDARLDFQPVGTAAVFTGDPAGFDIDGVSHRAFAAVNEPGSPLSRLHQIDLERAQIMGRSSLIAARERIRALTFTRVR